MKNLDTIRKPNITPMVEQYLSIKSAYSDCLLFYRMGDFYELFFDDAVQASKALEIHLTKRGRYNGKDIPMCGVPVHNSDHYLSKLIRRGFRVAVCEQTDDPTGNKKRSGKTLMHREVVRIVTPGTLTEETLLESKSNNYLVALIHTGENLALAWIDISTGNFFTSTTYKNALVNDLSRIDPRELLIEETLYQDPELVTIVDGYTLTVLPKTTDKREKAEFLLCKTFQVSTLEAFGEFTHGEILAAGMLINYVDLTQKGKTPHLRPPESRKADSSMAIDTATKKNLELMQTITGSREGSLLNVIDRTSTSAGGRLLRNFLSAPLSDSDQINKRLDSVEFYFDRPKYSREMKNLLEGTADIERAFSRLSLGRGGPHDLAVIRDTSKVALIVKDQLKSEKLPLALVDQEKLLVKNSTVIEKIDEALVDSPPFSIREGGYINNSFSRELHELRALRDESRKHIIALQTEYAQATQIPTLKIRYNNVLGYFVEVTTRNAEKITDIPPENSSSSFIHRQTMANTVRFSTVELGKLEGKIASARERALKLEFDIFENIRSFVLENAETLMDTAAALAQIDVAIGFAILAKDKNYIRPLIDNSKKFYIEGGRHPVVEDSLKRSGQTPFVANDCNLDSEGRLWLVTGPNMAGKSTFLRQNGLIVVLAHMGSFVPADSAHIGAVDCLFSRVGAADDLARGRSTFMVEMVETAAILHQATERSLVILDEIGRGTATYDGLSIAWSTVEYLHEINCCRSLFATHYHELTALDATLDQLNMVTMRIKEWKGKVVFLHQVVPGTADRSYGISVAKLAGLPNKVINRAKEVLKIFEQEKQRSKNVKIVDDLPLFSSVSETDDEYHSPLIEAIDEIDPDSLSPRTALELIYELKKISNKK